MLIKKLLKVLCAVLLTMIATSAIEAHIAEMHLRNFAKNINFLNDEVATSTEAESTLATSAHLAFSAPTSRSDAVEIDQLAFDDKRSPFKTHANRFEHFIETLSYITCVLVTLSLFGVTAYLSLLMGERRARNDLNSLLSNFKSLDLNSIKFSEHY